MRATDGINILSTVLPLSTSKIPGYYILKDIIRFWKVEGRRQPNRELGTQGMTQFWALWPFLSDSSIPHWVWRGQLLNNASRNIKKKKSPKKSTLSLAKTLREGLCSKTEILDNNCPSPTMHSRKSCGQPSLHGQNWSGESGCVTRCPKSPVFFLKITLFTYSFIFDCAGSSLLYRFFSSCSEWRATL